MNWDAIGAIGEIVGAAGVIISLLYLALQMRQSNRLQMRATEREAILSKGEINKYLGSSVELSNSFQNGVLNPYDLSEKEWGHFVNMFSPVARHCEASYLDVLNGFLTDSRRKSEMMFLKNWLSMPGPQRFFSELGFGYDPRFIELVERAVKEREASPDKRHLY